MQADYLKDPVTSASFSHDANCVLAATLNSTIRLLDKSSGEMLSDYKGHKNTDYKPVLVVLRMSAVVTLGGL
jgi:mitogen-activated protein kinase organizer 1